MSSSSLPLTHGPSDPPAVSPTAPRPILAESVSRTTGFGRGGSGPSKFSFLQVMGFSSPVVMSQEVPEHPLELPSHKPKLKTIRIITKDLIRDLM